MYQKDLIQSLSYVRNAYTEEGQMECSECGDDITQRHKLTKSIICVNCKQDKKDDFKWKMKTVGFNETATIAKTSKDWEVLRKQKAVKDI